MAGPSIEIRSATPEEAPQVAACLTAAFITDPMGRFMWPGPHAYLHSFPELAREFAKPSLEHAAALVAADLCGAALWLPPDVHANGEAMMALMKETAKPEHLADQINTFIEMGEYHPEEAHWYLPLIGVEPNAQGRGLGGALMQHATSRFDQEGALAYLESSNPKNITLYERHDFEVMGKIQVGAAPLITPMLRRPR